MKLTTTLSLVGIVAMIALSVFLGYRWGSLAIADMIDGISDSTIVVVGDSSDDIDIDIDIPDVVPTQIDTVYVTLDNGEEVEYEKATLDTTIYDDRSNVFLEIKYDEWTNLFDIKAHITAKRDSIYVEHTITRNIAVKPRFLKPTIGLSVGFGERLTTDTNLDNSIELKTVAIDFGVRVVEKYSLTCFIDTRMTFGLRFGLDL